MTTITYGRMSNGGMIQTLRRDGSWKDAFPVSYKPESTALQVAARVHRPVRIVNRAGEVIFEYPEKLPAEA